MVQESVSIENGNVVIPDGPSLGAKLDEVEVAQHLYVFRPPTQFRNSDLWPEYTRLWFT